MPIPDKELSRALTLLVAWFKKWKTGGDFQEIMKEGYAIVHDYDQYPVVWHLFISLLYELDARIHGGYTELTRNKLMEVINNGVR